MSNAFVIIKCVMCTINGMTFRAPPCIYGTFEISRKKILFYNKNENAEI